MKTTVVNIKDGKGYDVYIGRPSKWGNPFFIGTDGSRAEVIEKFREYLMEHPELLADIEELRGKRLGCYCVEKPISVVRQNKRCHGEVLLEVLSDQAF